MIIWQPLPFGYKDNNPQRIVIHAMAENVVIKKPYKKIPAGTYSASEWLRLNGLSAHALGCPNGDIIRCREDTQGGFHAKGFNVDSLGYEILVPGEHDYTSFLEAMKTNYMTKMAYYSLVNQVKEWMDLYKIKTIDRHSDLDPSRKKDPGFGFPIEDFLTDVYGD